MKEVFNLGPVKSKTSAKSYLWQQHQPEHRDILGMIQHNCCPEIIARILVNRKVTIESSSLYLMPRLKDLMPDPKLLKDMDKALEVAYSHIIQGNKIAIFGDYDVDGATSGAVLGKFLKSIGYKNFLIYIPDRVKEGYGPNLKAFENLKNQDVKLIITLDCGTLSFEPIEYARNNDVDVIVIDHHLSDVRLPEANAIINPNRFDEGSNLTYLAAVGMTFIFCVALKSHLKEKGFFEIQAEPDLFNLLDLVALGTVCDVVPLIGLNRAFVVQGLRILSKRSNIGLAALADIAGVDTTISTYHLGFVLGPRINAGGRVGESDLGVKLLTSDNYIEAIPLAKRLDKYNAERKAIESIVLEEAVTQAMNKLDNKCILVHGDGWHEGVIGIIAGRIKELHNKPTAVISFAGDVGKASARSVKGLDFGSVVVNACNNKLLIKGGGHAMAAGFSIQKDKLAQFEEFLNQEFEKQSGQIQQDPTLFYDGYLSLASINIDLANMIEKLGPYGPGNDEPQFVIKDVNLHKVDIFKDEHIFCHITDDYNSKLVTVKAFRIVGSDLGDFLISNKHNKIDILVKLRVNKWNGLNKAELFLEDARLSW